EHALGLACRLRDRAPVEVVAADRNGRGDLPLGDEPVDEPPELLALAVAEPRRARRQALGGHALHRDPDPARDRRIVAELVEDGLVEQADVLRVAGQGDPAARPATGAEVRPDEERNEAFELEGRGEAGALRLLADRVPVFEDDRALLLEPEHRLDVAA